MGRYIARRLWHAFICVFLVVCATFFLIHLAPGDPYSGILENPDVSPEAVERFREARGLDRPVHEQFVRYLLGVARGDLGVSTSQNQPVARAILARLPNTLLLMGTAILLSFAIGMVIGVIQAVHKGRATDQTLSAASLFFYAMPDFWLANMAAIALTYWVRIFPRGGAHDPVWYDSMSPLARLADRLEHLALPAITLTLLSAAIIARYQRSAMLDTLSRDYLRSAAAKGASRTRVVLRHALRNSLLPIISLAGLALPLLLGGAVFIERAFSWPGMGLLAVSAVENRDRLLVVGIAIMASILVALGSLLADISLAVVDPRLRERSRE